MVLENPGWHTHTPYQAEIAQAARVTHQFPDDGDGVDGMEVANASLLDEATAAAEAMTLPHRVSTKKAKAGERSLFLVSDQCFPQTIEVLRLEGRAAGNRPARRPDRPRAPR